MEPLSVRTLVKQLLKFSIFENSFSVSCFHSEPLTISSIRMRHEGKCSLDENSEFSSERIQGCLATEFGRKAPKMEIMSGVTFLK